MSPLPIAAVLAGGRSRRLGLPKAHLHTPEGPLARALGLRALRAGCSEAWVVVAAVHDLPLGAPPLGALVEAHRPHPHPLFGVAAALCAAPTPMVLVLPCDLPALDPATLAALISVGHPVRARGPGGPEPLLCVLPRNLAGQARALAAAGAPCRALAPHLPEINVEAAALRNLNHPADLEAARRDGLTLD